MVQPIGKSLNIQQGNQADNPKYQGSKEKEILRVLNEEYERWANVLSVKYQQWLHS